MLQHWRPTSSPGGANHTAARCTQLPERLGVRLPDSAGGAGGPHGGTASAQAEGSGDTSARVEAALAGTASSPLLRRLLAEAVSPAASGAAEAALRVLDVAAARDNEFGRLFASRERFPEVRLCAAASQRPFCMRTQDSACRHHSRQRLCGAQWLLVQDTHSCPLPRPPTCAPGPCRCLSARRRWCRPRHTCRACCPSWRDQQAWGG